VKHAKKIAIGFYSLAGLLALQILYGFTGGRLPLFQPGVFFVDCFSLAALYIPAFLAFNGLLVVRSPFNTRTLLRTGLTIIPFLTLSLLFHVLMGHENIPLAHSFIVSFGKPVGTLLLAFLAALEAVILWKLPDYLMAGAAGIKSAVMAAPVSARETTGSFSTARTAEFKVPAPRPDMPAPLNPLTSEELNAGQDPAISRMIDRILRGESLDEVAASPLHDERIEVLDIMEKVSPVVDKMVIVDESHEYEDEDFDDEYELAGDPGISFLAEAVPSLSEDDDDLDDLDIDEDEMIPPVSAEYRADEKLDSLINSLDEVLLPKTVNCVDEEEDRDHIGLNEKFESDRPVLPVSQVAFTKKKRSRYEIPVEGVLTEYPDAHFGEIDDSTRQASAVLEETLREFNISATVTGIKKGPVITMFELLPSPGVKLSRIVNLQDNIALRLAASRIRIVAPIPGKHAVGIEIPNKKRAIVSFSSLVKGKSEAVKEMSLPFYLGKDIQGGNQVIDLTKTPHLLIAGSTGSGKSVCVNALICSILYECHPADVKLLMVDPKIVELKLYNNIPHLLAPVITDTKKALQALQWCLCEMERRYSLLDMMQARDIKTFNKKIKKRQIATESMPYIVVIIDEFADLMATAGKELEGIVARLAAMSRAVGIHLVLATQRPSTDVITGLIKANFPSRIAFMVASKVDSRIIIDNNGADKLLGKGDMLLTSSWDPFPTRLQGAFLSEEEVERVADQARLYGEPEYIEDEIFYDEEDDEDQMGLFSGDSQDPLFDRALEIVTSSGKASASYLQRRLKIGYNRAARLVEEMESRGIVGPQNGSKPRDLIHGITERPYVQPSLV
jgi:S-DNA-T family DNA segregation ATPase FtsK/SpoIIIE